MRPLAKYTNTNATFDLLCLPFYAIYKAAAPAGGVDLFILDAADAREMQILSTIPWQKVDISVSFIFCSHKNSRFLYFALKVLIVKFLGDYKLGNLKIHRFMLDHKFRQYQGSKTHSWSDSFHLFIKVGSRYDVKHP